MQCRICKQESGKAVLCAGCQYLLNHGVDEESITAMHADKKTMKIWEENKILAEALGQAYYDSVLDAYDKNRINGDTKENFGFNMFVDGINCGIDVIMPLLDKEPREKVKAKVLDMVSLRANADRH